tara:strand:+ start:143 stop:1072 length:930 start_codon:yes stop_codon:yes gene_type:complete
MTLSIKRTSGYTIPDKIYVKEAGLWKECIGVYANKDGAWTQVFVNTVNITLSGLVKNINIWNEVVARIGSVPYPVVANVILNSGCNIVDDATTGTDYEPSTFAFTDGNFSDGSSINLTLNAGSTITGRGGNGGYGSDSQNGNGRGGQKGTSAIYTRTPIVINNNGVIGGGGGGGAGGQGQRTYHAAGNGGGGAGGYHEATSSYSQKPPSNPVNNETPDVPIPAGYGGIGAGPRNERNVSPKAANGTLLTGGAGGASSEGGDSRKGGNGGDIGQNGTKTGGYGAGYAGYAVDGYSYLTFINKGTFVGQIK